MLIPTGSSFVQSYFSIEFLNDSIPDPKPSKPIKMVIK